MAEALHHQRTTDLLATELPDPRFVDDAYIHWLYDENPAGQGIQVSIDEGDQREAHFAVIPQLYRNAAGPEPVAFSLNAVTRSTSQRRGLWSQVGDEVFAKARDAGRKIVVGVTNERSTPGAVKYLGYRLVGPLPVKLVVPRGGDRGVATSDVTDGLDDNDRMDVLSAGLDDVPVRGWVQCWSAEQLAWRLRRPHATYSVHSSPDLLAVSTVVTMARVRVAVIMALLPRRVPDDGSMGSGELIGAACRHHSAPVAVYAGFNAHVSVPGIPVPRRLRPAPLNLVCRELSDEIPVETFRLDRFEFLDMDAY